MVQKKRPKHRPWSRETSSKALRGNKLLFRNLPPLVKERVKGIKNWRRARAVLAAAGLAGVIAIFKTGHAGTGAVTGLTFWNAYASNKVYKEAVKNLGATLSISENPGIKTMLDNYTTLSPPGCAMKSLQRCSFRQTRGSKAFCYNRKLFK